MKRKEIKQALREMPIETVLMVGKSELTPKQRAFAKNIAMGYTGAESYRRVYSDKAKPKTAGDAASRMKADSRIVAEIEAYELALEAQRYRSSESLRALVIQSLVNVLIDPESKQSTKVTAAKVLGTVTEVAAFTERKEITTINGSDAIKAQIMDQLKTLMLGSGTADITDIEAVDLLSELNSDTPESAAESSAGDGENLASADPTHPVPHAIQEPESHPHTHTIPHEQPPLNIVPHEQSHPETDTPLSSKTPTPRGGI